MQIEVRLRNGMVYDGQRRRRGEVVAVSASVAQHLIETKKGRLVDERQFPLSPMLGGGAHVDAGPNTSL